MAESVRHEQIVKLDENNWDMWKMQVTYTLKANDLWDQVENVYVEPEGTVAQKAAAKAAWDKKDNSAMAILLRSLQQKQFSHVRNCTTPKAVFDRLEKMYADYSQANVQLTLDKFMSYRIKPGESLVDGYLYLEGLAVSLEQMNQKQTPQAIMSRIVSALPDETCNGFKQAWDVVASDNQTMDHLLANFKKLDLDQKNRHEEQSTSAIAFAFGRGKGGPGKKQRLSKAQIAEMKKTTKCNKCHQVGHWARECPTGKKNKKKKAPANADKSDDESKSHDEGPTFGGNIAFAFQHCANSPLYTTCDSGCNKFSFNRREDFIDYRKAKKPIRVTFANGEEGELEHEGTVALEVLCMDNVWRPAVIEDSVHNPNGPNLFNENYLALKLGWKVTSDDVSKKFYDPTGKLIFEAFPVNGVYVCPFRPLTKPLERAKAFVFKQPNLEAAMDWHEKLGHQCMQHIRKSVQCGAVTGIPLEEVRGSVTCEDCLLAKSTATPYPRRVTEKGGKKPLVGECLHADLTGLIKEEALEGYHYTLVVKDQASTFVALTHLKKKDHAPAALMEVIARFDRQRTDGRVKSLFTDKGTEFTNKDLERFLKKRGIVHFKTATACKQSNGIIEREMRTLKNLARTMLRSAKLGNFLWAEALNFAAYVRNRTCNSVTGDKTPVELMFGVRPDLSHLKKFGSIAYAHIPDNSRSTWDETSRKGYIVGYDSHTSAFYRVYYPGAKKIAVERHVEVVEPKAKVISVEVDTDFDDGVDPLEEQPEPKLENEPEVKTEPDEEEVPPKKKKNPDRHVFHEEEETKNIVVETGEEGIDVDLEILFEEKDNEPLDFFEKSFCEPEPTHIQPPEPAKPKSQPTISKPLNITVTSGKQSYKAKIPVGSTSKVTLPSKVSEPKPGSSTSGPSRTLRPREKLMDPVRFQAGGNPKVTDGMLFACALTCQEIVNDAPKTFHEAMNSPEAEEWKAAMDDEIASLEEKETWELIPRPKDEKVLDCLWNLTNKFNKKNELVRRKGRVCAKGYAQIPGVNVFQTFAHTCQYATIRLAIGYGAAKKMKCMQFDVKTAFLNSVLHERVLMEQPEGYARKDPSKWVCRLKRCIYGLRQSPRRWQETFTEALEELGLKPSQLDKCLYVGEINGEEVLCCIYVDDGLVFGTTSEAIGVIMEHLDKKFEMTVSKPSTYVGIDITSHDDGSFSIDQKAFIERMWKKFEMQDAKPISVPMQPGIKFEKGSTNVNRRLPFRELIGALLFVARVSRPDIAQAVSKLSQYVTCYDEVHWKAAKTILRYLYWTRDLCITYPSMDDGAIEVIGYCDAAFGTNEGSKSTTGLIFTINGAPLYWKSVKQRSVATDACVAEYYAMYHATVTAVFLRGLMASLGCLEHEPTQIFVDNSSAINIANQDSPGFASRTTHVMAKWHYTQEQVKENVVDFMWISGAQNPADILTKSLHAPVVKRHRETLKILPAPKKNPMNWAKEMEIEEDGEPTPTRPGVKRHQTFLNSAIQKAMYCLMMFCLVTGSVSRTIFQKGQPVLWTTTKAGVITGHSEVKILTQLVSPCSLLNGTILPESMVTQARSDCNRIYNSFFITELEKVCPRTDVIRKPRSITLFITTAALIIHTIVIAGLGLSSFVRSFRQNEVAKVAAEVDLQKVRNLELEHKMALVEDAIRKLANETTLLREMYVSLKQDVDDYATAGFTMSYINVRIASARDKLRQILHDWKLDRIHPSFLDMLNVTLACEPRCPLSLIASKDCSLTTNSDELHLNFIMPMIDPTLNILEADPFYMMVRRDNKTCRVTYTGPTRVIYSTQLNCLVNINPPSGETVPTLTKGCLDQLEEGYDSQHFQVQDCKPSRPKDEVGFIQVKFHHDQVYVYCASNNIALNGKVQKCPDDIFVLPGLMPFTINNQSYNVDVVKIVSRQQEDTLATLRTNQHLQVHLDNSSIQADVDRILGHRSVPQPEVKPEKPGPDHHLWTNIMLCCIVFVLIATSLMFLLKKTTSVTVHAEPVPTDEN